MKGIIADVKIMFRNKSELRGAGKGQIFVVKMHNHRPLGSQMASSYQFCSLAG
jgi:hypothetical protein